MRDGGLWELYGGVLAQQEADGVFHFLRLPSDLRGIEERRWSVAPRGHIAVRDFGIEPSQDSLALVESHVESDFHLLYMSESLNTALKGHRFIFLPSTPFDYEYRGGAPACQGLYRDAIRRKIRFQLGYQPWHSSIRRLFSPSSTSLAAFSD